MMRSTGVTAVVLGCALSSALLANTDASAENLALGRLCKTFSSIEAYGWSAAKLTDGKTGALGWSSKAFSAYADHALYPEFVVVDMGAAAEIDRIVLYPRGDGDRAGKGFPRHFSIHVCHEGEPWREILQKEDYPQPEDGVGQAFSFEDLTGRYVKIEATGLRKVDGKHHFQLSELEVFGRKIANAPLETGALPAETRTVATRLRCENRDNPVGIDTPAPRFSWWMDSSRRGERQTAYRVLVASSEEDLAQNNGDLWDSGTVEGDKSIAVSYAGKPLVSGKQYWWKVQLTDRDGKALSWSTPATFVMAKVNAEDWQGRWIGANADRRHGAVYLRKEIEVEKPVKRAVVHFCGLGLSELYIEGRRVGDYVVGPGFTTYNKRTQYLTFDVTDRFNEMGAKALAVILADGWYGLGWEPWCHSFHTNPYVDKPKLLLDLHLEYEDGTETVLTSDESWKWSKGEITFSWVAQEDIDMRKANAGWDRTGYDDSDWQSVAVVDGPEGKLVHQKEPPCRVIGEIAPVTMTFDQKAGKATFDFGREFLGWVRFGTKGQAGAEIKITVFPSNARQPRRARFTLAGTGGREVYEPRFWYNSIKKVVIEGVTKAPTLDDMTGVLVSSSWQPGGRFSSSDDLQNWLHHTARRTSINYTTYLPNDASREWKAWMQDPQNMFVANSYMFDAQTLYERWQWDIIDGQRSDGNCPNVTPGAFFDNYNSPWWGGCIAWVPWNWYVHYGDAALLKDSYPAMKRYVDYLETVAKGGMQSWGAEQFGGDAALKGMQDWGLDDWYAAEKTPRAMINTPAHYLYATIVSRTAGMMGDSQDARHYKDVAAKVAENFNDQLLNRDSGQYGANRTQAGQVMPLAVGMVPDDMRPAVEQALLQEIIENKNRLSTGFVSTPYLLQTVMDLAPELGWEMTTAQDYPSWYSMTAGSDHDLMMEKWDGGMVCMPSLGGNIVGWHYQSLGGIRPDPAAPGFKKIIIKPNVVGDLHWVECFYDSVHGRITSNWRRRDDQLIMDVTIPANTTATVYVPAKDAASVTESGEPIDLCEGVTFLRMAEGKAVFEVAAGTYEFRSTIR